VLDHSRARLVDRARGPKKDLLGIKIDQSGRFPATTSSARWPEFSTNER
jgi:hypothetical protein